MQVMERDSHTDQQLRSILSLNKVAVIGISKNPGKAAHYVPKYLFENGYDITPVNPTADQILGKKCHPAISDIDGTVDIVDVFRPSDEVLPIIPDIITIKPKVIWLQEGIHNLEAENLARDAGMDVVFNRCMLAEHRRLF